MKPASHADLLRAANPDARGRGVADRASRERRAADHTLAAVERLRRSGRWKRLRLLVLSRNPLCVECERLGLTVLAQDVDHLVPAVAVVAERGVEAFFDEANLSGICRAHHCEKTARETAAGVPATGSRDLDAIATVLSHVEGIPVEAARRYVEQALAAGQRHVVLPLPAAPAADPSVPTPTELRGEHP